MIIRIFVDLDTRTSIVGRSSPVDTLPIRHRSPKSSYCFQPPPHRLSYMRVIHNSLHVECLDFDRKGRLKDWSIDYTRHPAFSGRNTSALMSARTLQLCAELLGTWIHLLKMSSSKTPSSLSKFKIPSACRQSIASAYRNLKKCRDGLMKSGLYSFTLAAAIGFPTSDQWHGK